MQIIPIRDLKDTSKVSEMCNMSNEPIFVTKNGYGDMVVMSMKTYEEKMLLNDLMYSKSQADKGELLDGQKSMQGLRDKYVK